MNLSLLQVIGLIIILFESRIEQKFQFEGRYRLCVFHKDSYELQEENKKNIYLHPSSCVLFSWPLPFQLPNCEHVSSGDHGDSRN